MTVQQPLKNAGVIILAAGAATRFGAPKALAAWQEATLLSNAVSKAEAVGGEKVLVVLGAHADQLTPFLAATRSTHNPDWADGMGTSIAKGLASMLAIFPETDLILVLPVDQPLVSRAHLMALMAEARDHDCCALSDDGETLGPPAAIPRRFFDLGLKLDGKRGMKSMLEADECVSVPGDPRELSDIDTPEDLERLSAS